MRLISVASKNENMKRLSVPGSFHLTKRLPDPSILLQMTVFHSFFYDLIIFVQADTHPRSHTVIFKCA